jgi:uncharacterized protein (TIGR02147 family)
MVSDGHRVHSRRMADATRIDVFAYLDHRAFLRVAYEKGKERGLGYRAFSKRAGLRSPNYLKMVIDGQRNLTPQMAQRFARASGLSGEAAQYFEDLVAFAQAKSSRERSERYARLLRFRQFRKAHRLEASQEAYHSHWYYLAIRELVGCRGFREDAVWIAAKLTPNIRPPEAAQALEALLALGLLSRNAHGKLERTQQIVAAPPETRSTHLATFHRTMMAHAADSIDTVRREERDITAITMRLPSALLPELREKLALLRSELLAWSEEQPEADRVVQLNLQLFPLTEVVVAREEEN